MFDPYEKWLGIPKTEQPPNHYRLLGISPDEKDPGAIDQATLRLRHQLRKYQTGPHAEECTKILNEISRAREILSDPQQRFKYDMEFGIASVPSASGPSASELAKEPLSASHVSSGFSGLVIFLINAVIIAAVGCGVWYLWNTRVLKPMTKSKHTVLVTEPIVWESNDVAASTDKISPEITAKDSVDRVPDPPRK